MPAQRFHVALHGRPQEVTPGGPLQVAGKIVESLAPDPTLCQVPLPVTFEEAEASLTRLPRVYFEPDGSFGWFSEPGAPRWDIGGMLYDRGDRVMYAELTGSCPQAEFRQLVDALGGSSRVLVQLVQEAVFLEADAFCRILPNSL